MQRNRQDGGPTVAAEIAPTGLPGNQAQYWQTCPNPLVLHEVDGGANRSRVVVGVTDQASQTSCCLVERAECSWLVDRAAAQLAEIERGGELAGGAAGLAKPHSCDVATQTAGWKKKAERLIDEECGKVSSA